jgi:uncharacterized membrane protein YhfC
MSILMGSALLVLAGTAVWLTRPGQLNWELLTIGAIAGVGLLIGGFLHRYIICVSDRVKFSPQRSFETPPS